MPTKILAMCLLLLSTGTLLAQSIDIPNPEGVASDNGEILVLSTGLDSDFSNPAEDGAI